MVGVPFKDMVSQSVYPSIFLAFMRYRGSIAEMPLFGMGGHRMLDTHLFDIDTPKTPYRGLDGPAIRDAWGAIRANRLNAGYGDIAEVVVAVER